MGYGDIVPTTRSGRVVGMLIMFAGIGFAALFTGFLADRFIRQPRERAASAAAGSGASDGDVSAANAELLRELRLIRERLDRLERHGETPSG